jgi:hypothetical protein
MNSRKSRYAKTSSQEGWSPLRRAAFDNRNATL